MSPVHGSLGYLPANVTSRQRTGCGGGALDDAAARRDDDRRTLRSPRDTVCQRLNRQESHPAGCCTHRTPAPQHPITPVRSIPIVVSRIARPRFDGKVHMWTFCRDGTMRSGLRPIYQISMERPVRGAEEREALGSSHPTRWRPKSDVSIKDAERHAHRKRAARDFPAWA